MDRSSRNRPRKGRGALGNPACRFDVIRREVVDDGWSCEEPEPAPLPTTVTVDRTRSILSHNQSPDVPFERSLNPYRGCEHGCVYCFARPTHAYLGWSPGLDFESRLLVKPDAPRLLVETLRQPGYLCQPIAMGTNTDPYQPIERDWRVTRGILEVLADCRHPVSLVTKSALIERDLDLLADLAREDLVHVAISVTTLDRALARRLEPRAAAPQRRLQTIRRLVDAGVPTGVLVAPLIPALTDSEMEPILEACAGAGAHWAGYILLRLPREVRGLFAEWLEAHYPLKVRHVFGILGEMRGGQANDPRFGTRLTGEGVYADLLAQRFTRACKRLGLVGSERPLDTARFRPPGRAGDQLGLF